MMFNRFLTFSARWCRHSKFRASGMQAGKEVALRGDRAALDDVAGELIKSVQSLFILLDC